MTKIFKLSFATLMLISILLSLSACGGGKVVKTKDDSADYKSARSLPPLRKKSSPVVAAPDYQSGTELPQVVEQVQPSPQTTPQAQEPQYQADAAPITANIIKINDGVSRLQLDAPFEPAWNYLSKQLLDSGITIHNRNKSAGRISIGCGDLDGAAEVVRAGGWSILKRRKGEGLEYCALQLISDQNSTVVQVLNRNAKEVDTQAAEDIFRRTLN